MAGDWIKIEHVTPDKPEVLQMSQELNIDQDAVLGKLTRVWIWADQQSIEGEVRNDFVTLSNGINRLTSVIGFANAMQKAGWLSINDGVVSFPNFDRHNGKTAKLRALGNKRTKRFRSRKCNAITVTNALPEKRREEDNNNKKEDPKSNTSKLSPAPTFNPNGKTKYFDNVYLDARQLERVKIYYQKRGLNGDDIKEAIRLLDAWFGDNPKMRLKRTDDAKALIGWPFERVLERNKKQLALMREEGYAAKN